MRRSRGIPTRVSHELPRDLLVAAAAAEDLPAQPAVVSAAEGGELLIAVITLLTLAVWHPVLLQITVLQRPRGGESGAEASSHVKEVQRPSGMAVRSRVLMLVSKALLHLMS